MSLRRSPVRTAALLAANRANARRSTGPRTLEGKRQSALNALKHGQRAQALGTLLGGRAAEQFLELRRALWEALLPENGYEQEAVNRFACHVWTIRRETERRVATPAGQARHFGPGGGFPRPWRQRVRRRGWKVSVSVWLRRGRGKEGRCVARPAYGWQEGQGRLHSIVTVTASMHHPNYRLHRGPLGFVALRIIFRTKPESYRKKETSKYNIYAPKFGAAGGPGRRRARSRLLPNGHPSPADHASPAMPPGGAAPDSAGGPRRQGVRALLGRVLRIGSLLRRG